MSLTKTQAETYDRMIDSRDATIDTLRATVARLEAENAALVKDRDSWKREFEMYANAWKRELGYCLFNKRHLIDALVMTTRDVNEKARRWEAHLAATADARSPGALEYQSWTPCTCALAALDPQP